MPKRKAPSTLSGHAAEIWEAAYQNAWADYKPEKHGDSQEAYAAKVAWSAVKNDYKKVGDKWVRKSHSGPSFRLRITKARYDPKIRRIRWHAQAANDELDQSDEFMPEVLDPTLFSDLEHNFKVITGAIAAGETPPDLGHGIPRDPILDLAHYSSRLPPEHRDNARLGNIIKLYRDGRYLHADGYFDDTPMARLAAQTIMNDEEGIIRVSVGFFPDWGNFEVRDDVLYLKGGRNKAYLDHLAITSVPRIKSTSIDAEEVQLMSGMTIEDDAAAVLGDTQDAQAMVEKLEEMISDSEETRSMVLKTEGELTTETEEEIETEVEPITEESAPEPEATLEVEEEVTEEVAPEVIEEEIVAEPVADDWEWADFPDIEVTEEELVELPHIEASLAEKATTKKMGKRTHVAGDFLVVEDSEKPTTWHLPVKIRGTPNHQLMGAAWAALHGGYRGNKYAGPGKADAIKKLRALYKREDMDTPDTKSDVEEKSFLVGEAIYSPWGGATDFAGALEYLDTQREVSRIRDGVNVLSNVIDNIMTNPTVEDKASALETALSQFQGFLRSDQRVYSDAVEPEAETPQQEIRSDTEELVTESEVAVQEPVPEPITCSPGEVCPAEALPPEAQPLSMLEPVEGRPVTRLAQSFSDAVRKLEAIPGPVERKRQAVAEMTELANQQMQAALVQEEAQTTRVEQAVDPGVTELRAEVQELRSMIATLVETLQGKSKSDTPQTPQRPQRQSHPTTIQPASVTTRASTFSEVVDRLMTPQAP